MTDEQRLQMITDQLILVRDNLFRGMSKSIQKLQARSINEVLELENFTRSPQPAVQEPVGYVAENGVVDWNVCAPPILTDLYTTPSAQPAVPDALNPKDENPAYAAGWNDCRAEMLKGMKP
jgi:hypothetical protein